MWWWPHLAQLGPTSFDGRHHFELGQADMPRICLPPRRTISTEDISELQRRAGHEALPSLRAVRSEHPILHHLHLFKGADRALDGLGGDMGIPRGSAELGMAEQHLDHPHIGVGFQEVRGEAVPEVLPDECELVSVYQ
jgi:hypothetical protein